MWYNLNLTSSQVTQYIQRKNLHLVIEITGKIASFSKLKEGRREGEKPEEADMLYK